ncbi:MAG: hypothetical protein ACRD1F_11685 [Terriglobales bacterium]
MIAAEARGTRMVMNLAPESEVSLRAHYRIPAAWNTTEIMLHDH